MQKYVDKMSLLFNQTCIQEEMLNTHTHKHTHTHTHIYIYIYIVEHFSQKSEQFWDPLVYCILNYFPPELESHFKVKKKVGDYSRGQPEIFFNKYYPKVWERTLLFSPDWSTLPLIPTL